METPGGNTTHTTLIYKQEEKITAIQSHTTLVPYFPPVHMQKYVCQKNVKYEEEKCSRRFQVFL